VTRTRGHATELRAWQSVRRYAVRLASEVRKALQRLAHGATARRHIEPRGSAFGRQHRDPESHANMGLSRWLDIKKTLAQ